MASDRFLLALGDCNTLGTIELEPFAYPVILGPVLGVNTVNCGHTMCTIREGWQYAVRRLNAETAFLTIQFGLVDSWMTFRGAPYVLNYPDNLFRLVARKLVKKFKKTARKLGAHRMLGERHVVSISEYRETLQRIIRLARERSPQIKICLLATPPSLKTERNPAIERFNQNMREVANETHCTYLDTYSPFVDRPDMFHDAIHVNAEAHKLIAGWCAEALR